MAQLSHKVCSKCGEVKPLEDFPKDSRTRDGRRADCKACNAAKAALYREAHPGKNREDSARWRAEDPERAREGQRASHAAHREQRLAQNRAWAAGHREELHEQNRQYREDARAQVFAHYGQACACCGATEDLTLDHVNGGGTQHRAEATGQSKVAGWVFYRWVVKNGFPDGFQVLCFPCNRSKGTREQCRLNHEDRVA